MSQTKVKSGLLNFPDQTDFVKLPSGTTAQRPSSPEKGYSRYNTTDNKLEFWNGTIWQQLPGVVPPIITSISYPGDDLAADPAGGQTITINGSDFKAGATVTVDGTTPSVITFVSATEITFAAPAKAAGDYDIIVTNTDGGNATAVDGMTYNGLPSWTTPAGNLGTFAAGSTIPTITLVATEPDSGVVSYSVTTGALPTGLTLTGADIDGTVPSPAGQTTYNFSVTASDDENQESTERAFNIVVYLQVTNTVSEVDPFEDSSGVALYRFENNANDEGDVYNGSASNETYTTGVFGQAIVANGTNTRVDISGLNVSTFSEISISTWVYWQSTDSPRIFSGSTGSRTNRQTFEVQCENNQVRYIDNQQDLYDAPISLSDGWHHFVVTDNYNGNHIIYVDGQAITSNLIVPNGAYSENTSATMFYGMRNTGSVTGSESKGTVDQTRIFNKVLTPLEIESLYRERTVVCGGQADTLDILGDNSCIATYQLNGNANDLSGNYSGTPTDVSYGVGEFDLAGVFNGSSSFIEIPTGLRKNNDFTVSLWFNVNSIVDGQKLLAFRNGAKLEIGLINDGSILVQSGNNTSVYTNTSIYTTNTWYHFTLVQSSITGVTVYLNNSIEGSNTGATGDLVPVTGKDLIGAKYSTSLVGQLNGSIDQFRYFNKALNSSEVTTLYNETACDALACPGTTNTLDILSDGSCIAAYPLDGSPADLSGNYNGVQTDVTYPQGYFDLAGSFNGSGYLDLPMNTPSLFGGKNTLSLSLWFKTTTTGRNDFFNDYAGTSFNLLFRINNPSANGELYFATRYNGGTNTYETTGGNYNDGNWHHVVVVMNASTNQRVIYIDNSLETTYSVSSNGWSASLTQKSTLGAEYTGSAYDKFLNGQIDQVRIFNKALSAGEVTTLYNETACN